MIINKDALIEWSKSRFGIANVAGDEIQVPDPWWYKYDNDLKCWLNCSKCCYHAFKSGRKGNLVSFVMEIDGCSWEDAIEIVGGEESLHQLEKKLEDFFTEKVEIEVKHSVRLPPQTYPINSVLNKPVGKWAKEYLEKRKLNYNSLMVCVGEGKYKDRIIIPYYDKNGNLIYFNSRALSETDPSRYRGPSKDEFGIGKGDVLWMSHWPKEGEKIYLTEGEFDAMSLCQCGLTAGACGGKSLSDNQLSMLSPYRVALAFDSDKAGSDVYKMSAALFREGYMNLHGQHRISMVRPPEQCKDWNKFFVDFGKEYIMVWISTYEKICTEDTVTKMRFNQL